ncbi:hypothetical protein DCAR_0935082 [Daucus carota subsp. sativus]|uniref:S-adenosylmethionine-dependent methyltransferase n=1 Tax=Daucus carota subsp. sativus TaxID=79200 RepID=A0AAF0XWM1_DAUCS|nr:hypothetical protein DCAR_0935082 [Daucus carota subsp. sativus]
MEYTVAMNGGDGPDSYTRNSKIQENSFDVTKSLLIGCIRDHLDIQKSCKVFRMADLGCSVGPNTFSCFHTQFPGFISLPEFQVFFNDTFSNDFNTLFNALPIDRLYMAVGVPGSFYGQLFPKESMNLIHSSFSCHWISQVPKEVLTKDSRAWNKGRISYVRSSIEVKQAFAAQFMSDFKAFIGARSAELAPGGLIFISIPCRSNESVLSILEPIDILGDAFTDMVKEGLVAEELLDSFNLPLYIPTPSEVIKLVSGDKHLNILKVEESFLKVKMSSAEDIMYGSSHLRAAMEGIINKHFGPDILMDDLFHRYCNKFTEFSARFKNFDKVGIVSVAIERVIM